MSEFFRVRAEPKHHAMTLRQLAVAVHDAEESGDDITVIQCWDVLEFREQTGLRLVKNAFMEFYREEWKRRMTP